MRIPVALNVEVDVNAWAEEYGLAAHEVPADVKRYVLDLVRRSAPGESEILTDVIATR